MPLNLSAEFCRNRETLNVLIKPSFLPDENLASGNFKRKPKLLPRQTLLTKFGKSVKKLYLIFCSPYFDEKIRGEKLSIYGLGNDCMIVLLICVCLDSIP